MPFLSGFIPSVLYLSAFISPSKIENAVVKAFSVIDVIYGVILPALARIECLQYDLVSLESDFTAYGICEHTRYVVFLAVTHIADGSIPHKPPE